MGILAVVVTKGLTQSGTDPTVWIALISMISSVLSVLLTQGVKAFLAWNKSRTETQSKYQITTSKMALSDREQLIRFIDDMRGEQERTDKRLDDANIQMATLRTENAQLRSDLAVAKRDFTYISEHHEQAQAQWNQERSFMMERIGLLESEVKTLKASLKGG